MVGVQTQHWQWEKGKGYIVTRSRKKVNNASHYLWRKEKIKKKERRYCRSLSWLSSSSLYYRVIHGSAHINIMMAAVIILLLLLNTWIALMREMMFVRSGHDSHAMHVGYYILGMGLVSKKKQIKEHHHHVNREISPFVRIHTMFNNNHIFR